MMSSSFGSKKSRSILFSSSSGDEKVYAREDSNNLPNPNPGNYAILESKAIGIWLIVRIKYLDCTNYEGIKILVFKNCAISDLIKQKLIDPHFCENKKFLSPVARFEPTPDGWSMAKHFCYSMDEFE